MEIKNDSRLYQIGKGVAETGNYRLYLCRDGPKECLLQIATSVEYNGELQRAAYILRELQRRADELEEEYALVKTNPDAMLNYGLGFPELVDSFVYQEQGGRWINILAFRSIEDIGKLVPLLNITEKDRLRVDLRTSAWIMGKYLKLFVFTHSEGISIGLNSGNNILIEPDQHYVVIFDWTAAQIRSEKIPVETRRQEISQAAQAVITALGGNLETGTFPDDGDKNSTKYADYLLQLARGNESNAKRAHAKFYELIDSLWKREYYPFTTKLLG